MRADVVGDVVGELNAGMSAATGDVQILVFSDSSGDLNQLLTAFSSWR